MRPILAVVPGLTSDNDEIYITNLLVRARRQGFRPVVINYRGASDTPLSNHTLYCAGSVDDIRQPLEYIYEKYCQQAPIFLIGNSMGANIVANYIGEEGAGCFLKAAVCVQAPMKMWECGSHVQEKNFGFYNYILGQNVKRKIEIHASTIRAGYLAHHGIDLDHTLRQSRHLIDIDTHLTAVTFGYGTLDNYYDTASCIHRIPKIKTPTFFLMAKDDPIIGPKAIAFEECQSNPYCLLGVTEHGGHLGFFESVTRTDQWFVEPVFEFLS